MSTPIAWLSSVEGGPRRVNHAAAALYHRYVFFGQTVRDVKITRKKFSIYLFGGYCSMDSQTNEPKSIDIFLLDTSEFFCHLSA